MPPNLRFLRRSGSGAGQWFARAREQRALRVRLLNQVERLAERLVVREIALVRQGVAARIMRDPKIERPRHVPRSSIIRLAIDGDTVRLQTSVQLVHPRRL